MNFIKLKDERYNPVYIRINAITAVYYDYREKATAIDYGKEETMYVQDKVEEIAERLRKLKGGE